MENDSSKNESVHHDTNETTKQDAVEDTEITSDTMNNSAMMEACTLGSKEKVQQHLLSDKNNKRLLAAKQDEKTGLSPLMMAAKGGHLEICEVLLENGAPWNAIDRMGKCAGDYATEEEHWNIVNLLVDAGTKAELILGATIRSSMKAQQQQQTASTATTEKSTVTSSSKPVEHEPCTKPNYLTDHAVRYTDTAILDNDGDAIMMEWEKPLMNMHASILTSNGQSGKRILNIGFGMGIIDTAIQKYNPAQHVIIEAHPQIHENMKQNGWCDKPNVQVHFGKWQDVLPELISCGKQKFDGIFYDTYGEHFTDLEDFQQMVSQMLEKPNGIYSFFNGLAPDNLFFHGVACQCVKLQLAKLGMDSEFARKFYQCFITKQRFPSILEETVIVYLFVTLLDIICVACEIQVDENVWKGVRRKYWHGNTYYLPIITWKKERDEPHNGKKKGSNDTTDRQTGTKKKDDNDEHNGKIKAEDDNIKNEQNYERKDANDKEQNLKKKAKNNSDQSDEENLKKKAKL